MGRRLGRTNLTASQLLEVLPPIAAGATVNETARRLHMSPDAVNRRLRQLRRDLGARNTVHLVSIAYRRGLLEVGDA